MIVTRNTVLTMRGAESPTRVIRAASFGEIRGGTNMYREISKGTRATRSVGVAWPLAALLAIGCGDMTSPSSDLDPNVAAVTEGDWYRPPVTVTWQWQLLGTINTSYDVDLYDIDLFDSPNATIQALQAEGRRVICYFSAGSAEDFRSDYGRFADSDLGEVLEGFEGEVWVDIRSQNVFDIMLLRLDRAVANGCDGVEPDNVDGYTNDTGFDLTATDQLAFNRHLANEAHRRGLSVALKNAGDQAAELVDYFDFELNEQCHEFNECGQLQVFLDRDKPVLNVEYVASAADAEPLATTVCPTAIQQGLRTLIMPLDLNDAFRVACL